jgi:hypothetical protein
MSDMTPDQVADRWFRRYEPNAPVEMWRKTFRYGYVRMEVALRTAWCAFVGSLPRQDISWRRLLPEAGRSLYRWAVFWGAIYVVMVGGLLLLHAMGFLPQ